MQGRLRELALFDLGIDSKLRACDLLSLRVRDVCHGDRVAARAIVLQQKTQRPVQFEITPPTRELLAAWIKDAGLDWLGVKFLFRRRMAEFLTSTRCFRDGSADIRRISRRRRAGLVA